MLTLLHPCARFDERDHLTKKVFQYVIFQEVWLLTVWLRYVRLWLKKSVLTWYVTYAYTYPFLIIKYICICCKRLEDFFYSSNKDICVPIIILLSSFSFFDVYYKWYIFWKIKINSVIADILFPTFLLMFCWKHFFLCFLQWPAV